MTRKLFGEILNSLKIMIIEMASPAVEKYTPAPGPRRILDDKIPWGFGVKNPPSPRGRGQEIYNRNITDINL